MPANAQMCFEKSEVTSLEHHCSNSNIVAGITGAIYYFRVWLFWKILIGYSQLYTPDENKQVRNMHIAYY